MIWASVACDEDTWLEETPLDFYSPETSFTEPGHFNSAVARLYRNHRDKWVTPPVDRNMILHGTWADNLYSFYPQNSSAQDAIVPENVDVRYQWEESFKHIFSANVIINRITDEKINFKTENERAILNAEAHFHRAFAYHNLCVLYGGVPLVLEEISSPKRDFVRASKEEIWAQVISDLEFAIANLPYVTDLKEDGRLTKAAAYHLLTEVYVINEEWDKAINAASAVIDDPNYELMTERFGTRKDEPGDVFWDLFRRDNQNRHGRGGLNKEGIWVSQYEYLVPGGGKNLLQTRAYGQWYWQLAGKDGVPLFFGHSSQNGGRSFGWAANNDFINFTIWEDDWDDMRNSENNIRRQLVADNPNSAYYGQIITEDMIESPGPYHEFWRPFWAKYVPFNNFPDEVITNNPYPGATASGANGAFTDSYVYRLAETYLLRAEAYLGKGQLELAATDINVVRARANADPVSPADVDIDYILDERLRELCYEEKRVLTLMRTGKMVERAQLHNPHHNGKYASFKVPDRVNTIWPIPASEIERNTEAVLEQNPGY